MTRRSFLGTGVVLGGAALAACTRSGSGTSGPSGPGTGAAGGTATGGGQSDDVAASARVTYGDDPSQWVDRYDVPAGTTARGTAVAVIHGGFWRAEYDASLGAPLAADLAARGFPAWNVEYRRVGTGTGGGGGYPATLDDVRAALLATGAERIVTLGHSAGGHLAVWAAGEPDLAGRVVGAVSQAGVLDLVGAADENLGSGATQDLLGGPPAAIPDRYAAASPLARLPLGVPVRCVHGTSDTVVPLTQSRTYVDAARATGDDASLTTVDGDHFVLIDTTSAAWATIVDLVGALTVR